MTQPAHLRHRTWQILTVEDPADLPTKAVNFFLLTLIVLNVVAVILGSVKAIETRFEHSLFAFEAFSVAVFSVEYLARVWSCVSDEAYAAPVVGRLRFMLTPMALVDLAAVLPFFLTFLTLDLRVVRALRMLRLARIAKLGRYSSAVGLLGRVVVNRKEELILTVLLMALLIVLTSSFMYYAEHEAQPDKFPDIPSAMWWSVVTLTTVGYGDVYPVTALGRVFAACVSIFGVGMVALPTGILGASFVEEIRKEREAKGVCPHCGENLE